ncbi:hypothetical protein DD236_07265 [Ancrocorticia populi]|uniref:Uncharacterized protein n=1 Tax=Ancrocorticia populi TaxID=2175228 RepID=A0A2V1KAB7_9ACTO|nr:hypothetical protein DD236_07265 [Ancrocorticia populi]
MRNFRPVTTRYFLVTTASIAIFTGALTASEFSSLIFSWQRTSFLIRDATALSGPVLAIFAASTASVRRTAAIGPIPVRGRAEITHAHTFPILIAGVLGWIIGILPIIVITAIQATAGGPNLLVFATTILLLTVWTSGGYFVGVALKAPFSYIVTGVAGMAWVYLPEGLTAFFSDFFPEGFSFLSIAPIWQGFHPGIGWEPTLQSILLTIGLYLALLGTFLWALNDRRGHHLMFVIPATVAVIAVSSQPELVQSDNAEPVCSDIEGVTVCVHPEEHAAFPAIATGIQWATTSLPQSALPEVMTDFADPNDEIATLGLYQTGASHEISTEVLNQVGQWSTGVWSCTYIAMQSGSGVATLTSEQEAMENIQFFLFNKAFALHGVPEFDAVMTSEDQNFTGRVSTFGQSVKDGSPGEAGAFIADHQDELQRCDPALLSSIPVAHK